MPTIDSRELMRVIDMRINNALCETSPNQDDSVTGINEAWDIVRRAVRDVEARDNAVFIEMMRYKIALHEIATTRRGTPRKSHEGRIAMRVLGENEK